MRVSAKTEEPAKKSKKERRGVRVKPESELSLGPRENQAPEERAEQTVLISGV